MRSELLTKVSTALRRPSADDRVVVDGRVACPRAGSGDVEVDRCHSCPFFRRTFASADGTQWLTCSSGRRFDQLP